MKVPSRSSMTGRRRQSGSDRFVAESGAASLDPAGEHSGESTVRTTCPYCGVGCGVTVQVGARGMIQVSGDRQHPANFGRLCSKGAALAETLDLDGRLLEPVVHGQVTDWDTALNAVAEGLAQTIRAHGPESVAFYVSGQLLTEDYYVANKLMKGFIGSANIDTNSRLCMSSAVVAYQRAFGEDFVPCQYSDLEQAELIVLVGSNLAWTHPVLFQRIQAERERRTTDEPLRLVVIDPRRTSTAEAADLHLALAPGSDGVLLNGLLRHLAREERLDFAFLETRVSGFAESLAAARDTAGSIPQVALASGLSERDIAQFYQWFAAHERVVTGWSQGVNQTAQGVALGNAIINLHLATGRLGRPGMGPFSLTGQPNAMGGREVGGLATQLVAHRGFDAASIDAVAKFWDAPNLATQPGLKAVDLFAAIESGQVRAVWIMGTNPAFSLPDASRVDRALSSCPLVVVSDCVADNQTLRHSHIRLPAAAWGEKDGTVTNSERRISRQRAFLPQPGCARPDWWIVSQVGQRMGYAAAFSYASPAEIFREYAALTALKGRGEAQRLLDLGALANLDESAYAELEPIQWPASLRGDVTAGEHDRRADEAQDSGTAGGCDDQAASGIGDRSAAEESAGVWTRTVLNQQRHLRMLPLTPSLPPTLPKRILSSQHDDLPMEESLVLRLNSGRLRDHWHSLTRSAKTPRLTAHRPEPLAELNPADARRLGIAAGELLHLQRYRESPAKPVDPEPAIVIRAVVDAGQREGSVFVPIHWSEPFAATARVGTLLDAVIDPLSGQPAYKHGAVRVTRHSSRWQGFLLSRTEPVMPAASADHPGCTGASGALHNNPVAPGGTPRNVPDYRVKSRIPNGFRLEFSGMAAVADWRGWLLAQIPGQAEPEAWLVLDDSTRGSVRLAALGAAGELQAILMVAPTRAGCASALPARDWLIERLADARLTDADRRALLSGRPPVGSSETGKIICSCLRVGERTLLDAIRAQRLTSVDAVGASVKAGTECGSCRPEIRRLLATAATASDEPLRAMASEPSTPAACTPQNGVGPTPASFLQE
ncbi:MAG: molybdopterin-dependent oxidoreductase [Thioalkalivibrionaceae bacterium]